MTPITNNVPKKLGEILEELGYITKEQIEVALNIKKSNNKIIGEIFQDMDFVTSSEIAEAIAKQENKKFSLIFNEKIDDNVLKKIPKVVCETNSIFPLHETEDGHIVIVKNHEADIYLDGYIKQYTGNDKIIYYISDRKTIHRSLQMYYPDNVEDFSSVVDKINKGMDVSLEHVFETLFLDAVRKRASDIHITPEKDKFFIFYRIDGVLKYRVALRKEIYRKFENYIKVKAELDISNILSSLDGRFSMQHMDEKYDIRVSFLNLNNIGTNIVLRILTKNNSMFNLMNLGINQKQNDKIQHFINKPHGIILVTGPTGSGKTTTLYSMLRKINSLQRNILTVEDPIEYKFSFIKQTQINTDAGYDFPDAIKTFMRQDPDVILVGEIRDPQTAELTIRAAITGHLVISTVHTNDAVSTIPRLLDLGIKEYMISSSVVAVVSQRLVRKLCNSCKKEKIYTKNELEKSFLFEHNKDMIKDGLIGYEPCGCKFCNFTGYTGREAVIEILEFDKKIQEMVLSQASTLEIEEYAQKNGMNTIKESAVDKFLEGITSLSELERVIK